MPATTEPQAAALRFLADAGRASRRALGAHLYPAMSERARWARAEELIVTLRRMGLVQHAGVEHPGSVMLTAAGRKIAKAKR